MKTLILAIVALLTTTITSYALPEPTGKVSAKDSLRAFEAIRGRQVASTVVGVTGFFGQDQPQQWRILVADVKVPNLLHEYAMQDGAIVVERHFSRRADEDLPSIPIVASTLRFDSTQAFKIAEMNAKNAGVGFESVHYQLRCRDLRNEPVWALNMIDAAENVVGVQYISALSGQTLRTIWNHPGTQQYTSANQSKDGILDKIGKTIGNAGKSIADVATPQKTSARRVPNYAPQTNVVPASRPIPATPQVRRVVPLPVR